jgi:hypothetical protein
VSSTSIHTNHLQRRVVRVMLIIAAVIALIGIPLMVLDEQRLELAHRFGIAPGAGAEKLAEGDEEAVLVIVPLGEYSGEGREQYAYQAMYIARPAASGMILTDIETDAAIELPLASLAFTAADADGTHILFRGPTVEAPSIERAVVLETESNTVEELPEGQLVPDLPGDWETETWEKVTGLCDRVSPSKKYIACFNRPDAASYLAGDWQVDVQIYGEFQVSEPVYRGIGFLPILGFAHDDTWLYFQNETGIYRIEIPASLQEYEPNATPQDAAHKMAAQNHTGFIIS